MTCPWCITKNDGQYRCAVYRADIREAMKNCEIQEANDPFSLKDVEVVDRNPGMFAE